MKKKNSGSSKIPVTVITGFLGSGKTTLINRILTEEHGIRFAIIENEFGEIGIDQDLVLNEKEEIIEMNNGCICCTVRGDLIRIIKKLIESENPPDHILIETTGLADPAPVAQTFLTDPNIAKATYLDSILTLVDIKHIEQQLISTEQAKNQVAFADIIFLNKIDLANEGDLKKVENRIREINRFAKILYSNKGQNISLEEIFNVGGFDVQKALSVDPKFLEIEYPFEYAALYNLSTGSYKLMADPNGDEESMKFLYSLTSKNSSIDNLKQIANPVAILFSSPMITAFDGDGLYNENTLYNLSINKKDSEFLLNIKEESTYAIFTEHIPSEFNFKISKVESGEIITPKVSHEFRAAHTHDSEVTSVGIEIEGQLDPARIMFFIDSIVKNFGTEIYRFKGILSVKGEYNRVVLQGVHMLYEMKPAKRWESGEIRKSTIIFIGKNLDRNILTQGFLSCKM